MSAQPVSRRAFRSLIGVSLLASLLVPRVFAAPSGRVQAVRPAVPAARGKPASGVAISGRPSHWQTQGPDAKRATCDTTTLLSLIVTFRGKTGWSRGTSLRFVPDKGVSIVTAIRKGKSKQSRRSSAPLNLSLARPTHGHSSANLTLAVTVRSARGSAGKRLTARLGGLVQVLQGKKQLGRSTVRVTSRVACVARAASKAPAPIPVAHVDIAHFAFSPMTVTVAAGTRVIWTNRDQVAHTVTASDGSWGSSTLARGVSFNRIFGTPGIYHYICAIHPYMKGTVVVLSASSTPTTSGGATSAPPGTGATAAPTATDVPLPSATSTPVPAAPTATPVPSSVPPTATPAQSAVSIVDFAFNPGTITIQAGQTVVWTNNGQAPHTVTADDNSWTSNLLNHGDTYSKRFDTPGVYHYHCSVHPNMTAAVVVNGPASTPTPTDTPTPSPTPTQSPTSTPTPTDTPTTTPTATTAPTDTPMPATATNTAGSTDTPTVTDTPVPPSPTSTPIPATATNTEVPSDTPTVATDTATATATDTPTAVPPTNTPTSLPATDTPTATPTSTDTATSTPTGTATNTAVPADTATDTPVPPTDTPTNTPNPTSTVASTPVTVTISNFAFSPITITIQAGQSVQWTDMDPNPTVHTVTADDNSFNSGDLHNGDAYTLRFDTPGTYKYHCNYHPFMKAAVVVN